MQSGANKRSYKDIRLLSTAKAQLDLHAIGTRHKLNFYAQPHLQ